MPAARASSSHRWRLIAVAAAGIVAVPVLLLAASADRGGQAGPALALPSEDGMEHVHGLGVDPADGVLYAATHYGVFSVAEDGTTQQVGNRQDTMGFTITGPNTFLGSGHPDPREDAEPLLGLIESSDAGRTWTPLSLRGQADFHALQAVTGSVYGYDATSGTFMASSDRTSWERRSQLPMRDFIVDPEQPDAVLATTESGLVRSGDGGRSWAEVAGAPPLVVLARRGDAGGLFGVDALGTVHMSEDDGATWTSRASVGAPPEAMTVDGRTMHVAVRGGGILTSTDGGASFTPRYTGT